MKNNLDPNKIVASEEDYLFIDKSQISNAGNGLFTAIPIYKDEIIALFKGEVLTKVEAEKRVKQEVDQYFMNLLNGTILDCKNTNCFAKYANDASGYSKSNFKNNCIISIDENNTICLIAIRKIKVNEEIFCSYGKRYWKKHS